MISVLKCSKSWLDDIDDLYYVYILGINPARLFSVVSNMHADIPHMLKVFFFSLVAKKDRKGIWIFYVPYII